MLDLSGKRALVTGAGRRVGAAIALALGAEGMRVGVHFNESRVGADATCQALRAAGGEGIALQADLRQQQSAERLVDDALHALGGLDVLVLSAGTFERGELGSIHADDWQRALALNLEAPFWIAQRASEALRASRGSIVAITCISRLRPYRGYLPYEVSKAGLHQLMRLLALELAPEVRVNAVAPGSVLPPEEMSASELEALRASIPLGRLGSARDVADAVVHLARHPNMTGSEIVVDGGRTLEA